MEPDRLGDPRRRCVLRGDVCLDDARAEPLNRPRDGFGRVPLPPLRWERRVSDLGAIALHGRLHPARRATILAPPHDPVEPRGPTVRRLAPLPTRESFAQFAHVVGPQPLPYDRVLQQPYKLLRVVRHERPQLQSLADEGRNLQSWPGRRLDGWSRAPDWLWWSHWL